MQVFQSRDTFLVYWIGTLQPKWLKVRISVKISKTKNLLSIWLSSSATFLKRNNLHGGGCDMCVEWGRMHQDLCMCLCTHNEVHKYITDLTSLSFSCLLLCKIRRLKQILCLLEWVCMCVCKRDGFVSWHALVI